MRSDPKWSGLASLLAQANVEIADSGFGSSPRPIDGLVALNHCPAALEEAEQAGVPLERRVVILLEPRAALPSTHSRRTLSRYGHVMSPSPRWPHSSPAHLFAWPQHCASETDPDSLTWRTRQRRALIVQANKFRAAGGERYSLRRGVIDHAQRTATPLDVAGPAWNRPALQNAREWFASAREAARAGAWPSFRALRWPRLHVGNSLGAVASKDATASRYRMAICIENSGDYVSEKLFDAIRAWTLPIYVGPTDLIPAGLDLAGLVAPPHPREIVARTRDVLAWRDEEQFNRIAALHSAAVAMNSTFSMERLQRQVANRIIDMLR